MTTTSTPRAGRREWIGLAVLALARLLYVMDIGSGYDREAAADDESEQSRDNGHARNDERTHREARRTPAPVPEA